MISKYLTIKQILDEAVKNTENINVDDSMNWSFVDADLWLHPDSDNFSIKELSEGFDEFIEEMKKEGK